MATTSAIALAIAAFPLTVPSADNASFVPAAHADSCCFVGETLVLLANGRSCPISKIQVGAFVMGMDGSANRVLRVERPRLGQRKLYAFNGERPFVTAEHPFMTKQGWKAINPDAAGHERWTLEISALRPGNRVARARVMVGFPRVEGNVVFAAEPEVELKFETIHSIEPTTADPDLVVYNLILNGSHTYFADGYLVHNKNPDNGNGGGNGNGNGGGNGNGSSGSGSSSSGSSSSDNSGSSGSGSSGVGTSGSGSSSSGTAVGSDSLGISGSDQEGSGQEGSGQEGSGQEGNGQGGNGQGGNGQGGSAVGAAGPPGAAIVTPGDPAPAQQSPAAAAPPAVAAPSAPPPQSQGPPREDDSGQRYQVFGGERPDPSALEQVGPDLSAEEERSLIERGWE